MCNDWFSIGPFTLHGYGACIATGLLLALLMACARAKKRSLSEDHCYSIVFVTAIFGFLGAKIMYIIVEWKDFIANPRYFFSSSGFVVYGGITGGTLAVLIYCLIKKINFIEYLELCFPSVALAQGFGRLGCFCAGCCYGKETDSWIGIVFKNSLYAPNNVKLIPAQLISSAGDFLNMALLLIIAKHTKKKGVVTGCYVLFYSIGRFLVEMLRDDDRGTVGNLSTSQFYGIFTFIIGAVILVIAYLRKPAKSLPESEEVTK